MHPGQNSELKKHMAHSSHFFQPSGYLFYLQWKQIDCFESNTTAIDFPPACSLAQMNTIFF